MIHACAAALPGGGYVYQTATALPLPMTWIVKPSPERSGENQDPECAGPTQRVAGCAFTDDVSRSTAKSAAQDAQRFTSGASWSGDRRS
jgi:hypothetical protein